MSTSRGPAPDSREFSKLLLEAFDYGLLMLGEGARQAIYSCIESSYQITRDEIPEKLEDLHGALVDLLGKGGNMVEMIAAEKLYKTLHLAFEPKDDWALLDYVNYVKKVMPAH